MIAAEGLYEMLLDAYGEPGWWSDDPYRVIFQSVLVQNTAWPSVVRVCDGATISPEAVMGMDVGDLEDMIRPCGFARAKVRTIRSLTEWYVSRGCDVSGIETEALREELMSIRGVGAETADVILVYAFRRPSFVIDAYTRRLLERLGDERWDDAHIRDYFEGGLPRDAEIYGRIHRLILEHCIGVCRKTPRCSGCVLSGICGYAEAERSGEAK